MTKAEKNFLKRMENRKRSKGNSEFHSAIVQSAINRPGELPKIFGKRTHDPRFKSMLKPRIKEPRRTDELRLGK